MYEPLYIYSIVTIASQQEHDEKRERALNLRRPLPLNIDTSKYENLFLTLSKSRVKTAVVYANSSLMCMPLMYLRLPREASTPLTVVHGRHYSYFRFRVPTPVLEVNYGVFKVASCHHKFSSMFKREWKSSHDSQIPRHGLLATYFPSGLPVRLKNRAG